MLDATSRARAAKFEEVLKASLIDLPLLRSLAFNGIPDESHQRALCWRILLSYLHPNKSSWAEHLRKHRQTYRSYVDEILVNPAQSDSDVCDDHPLATHTTSAWSAFFKDNQVLQQINKDVRRLCPEISFFQQPTSAPHPRLSHEPLCRRVSRSILESEIVAKDSYTGATKLINRKCASEEYTLPPPGQEAHWQIVERILFVYSKLNPGVSYVQGMNELLGPIYYVFASDNNKEWRDHAEADTFFCFQNLMAEVKDNFIKNLDGSNCGIDALMSNFYSLLQSKDPELYKHLVEVQDLVAQYYAFRWLSLMLSQEFLLPDVIRIWDTLFADPKRFEMLQHICLAMLIHLRYELLANDFTHNMKLLQNYPPATDVGDILKLASELRDSLV